MPKQAKGELRWGAGGGTARITIKGKHRESYALPTCKTREQAEERMLLLANLAQRFRRAGVVDSRDARQLLETAASCAAALLPGVLQVAGELVGGKLEDASNPDVPTFEALAKDWTSGKLSRDFPDHIKAKDWDLDRTRLEKLAAIDVGGIRLGEVPLDAFTLDHGQKAMAGLPEEAKRPGTRRQYAQLLNRVLALAVYPCRILKANPLPKGFLPKIGKPPTYPYLYPSEDAALGGCGDVSLARRVLFSFLAREGCRVGEAAGLKVADVDLERGAIKLDENKTDDPRDWALDPGVTRALKAWVEQRGATRADWLFVDEHGRPLSGESLADELRSDLRAAGVDRKELLEAGKNRQPIRVHDLRGTFITLALANGRSETWVADRTGHTSSQMINRYRRRARGAEELELGALIPMDQAVHELCQRKPTRAEWQPERLAEVNSAPLGSDSLPRDYPENRGSTRNRTEDQRIKNPLL
jgi:integrase